MQPYSKPNGRYMEDDLNIFENGRRLNFFERKKTEKYCNQKQTKQV
jgi:hypothetical protein